MQMLGTSGDRYCQYCQSKIVEQKHVLALKKTFINETDKIRRPQLSDISRIVLSFTNGRKE
jgi:hypothetical protein